FEVAMRSSSTRLSELGESSLEVANAHRHRRRHALARRSSDLSTRKSFEGALVCAFSLDEFCGARGLALANRIAMNASARYTRVACTFSRSREICSVPTVIVRESANHKSENHRAIGRT